MPDSSLRPGMRVAERYDLLSVLGEGGMAIVYEAHDILIQRRVALKVLQASKNAARFEREARAASALSHPAVVNVFGIGTLPEGQPYIALEFIEGETLVEAINRTGPISAERALALLMPVVGALAEAHAAGIVHRDIKPSNLILQRAAGQFESLRLLDFGIASMDEPDGRRLTRTGEVFGTPEFMAPEQATSKPVGPPADVWAIGVVLYELLTGRAPFTGAHAPGILYQVVNEPMPPLDPFVPVELAELIGWCLSKDPADRPQDAGALLEAMEGLLTPPERSLVSSIPAAVAPPDVTQTDLATAPTEPPEDDDPVPGARIGMWLLAGMALTVAAIAAWWFVRPDARPRLETRPIPSALAATAGAPIVDAMVVDAAPPVQDAAPPPMDAAPPPKDAAPPPKDAAPPPKDAAPPPKDAAPPAPDAAPKTVARPKADDSMEPAERLLAKGHNHSALRWLRKHRKRGSAMARDGIELRARIGRNDMGLTAKVLKRMIKRDPKGVPPVVRTELLSALASQKYWRTLVKPLTDKRFFPIMQPGLLRMAQSKNAAARWRAVRVISDGKGKWRLAKTYALTKDLRAASNCADRKRIIVSLGKLGQTAALGPIKAERNRVGFSNLCMGSAIDDALTAIRDHRRKR